MITKIELEVIPGETHDKVILRTPGAEESQTVNRDAYVEQRWGRWYNVNQVRANLLIRAARDTAHV